MMHAFKVMHVGDVDDITDINRDGGGGGRERFDESVVVIDSGQFSIPRPVANYIRVRAEDNNNNGQQIEELEVGERKQGRPAGSSSSNSLGAGNSLGQEQKVSAGQEQKVSAAEGTVPMCPQCSKTFSTVSSRDRHMSSETACKGNVVVQSIPIKRRRKESESCITTLVSNSELSGLLETSVVDSYAKFRLCQLQNHTDAKAGAVLFGYKG